MSTVDQIELPTLNHNSSAVKVDTNSLKVERVSFRTLYFKYATKRDIWYLCLGIVCTRLRWIVNSSCSGIWYSSSCFFYLLRTHIGRIKFPRCRLSYTSYITIPKHSNDACCCNIRFFRKSMSGLFCW